MIIYLVQSWTPWDCNVINKKAFLDKEALYEYLIEYHLNKDKEEELTVSEVELGEYNDNI